MDKTLMLRATQKGGHIHITFFFGVEGSRHNMGTIAIDNDNYNYFISQMRYGKVTIEATNFSPLKLRP
jgi:hypothetical protein